MSERLIEELKEQNLCTYFVLPLLGLSKTSFVKSNFIDCYLTADGKGVAVRIYDRELVSRTTLLHPEYQTSTPDEQTTLVHFRIPVKWRRDITYFREGKFSKMSELAKNQIRRYSGLQYKAQKYGQTVTDARLLALDRDEKLRRYWEQYIGTVLDDDDELLSIPGEGSYL